MHSSATYLMAKKQVTEWLIVQCLCVQLFLIFFCFFLVPSLSAKRSIYYNMQFVNKYGIFSWFSCVILAAKWANELSILQSEGDAERVHCWTHEENRKHRIRDCEPVFNYFFFIEPNQWGHVMRKKQCGLVSDTCFRPSWSIWFRIEIPQVKNILLIISVTIKIVRIAY